MGLMDGRSNMHKLKCKNGQWHKDNGAGMGCWLRDVAVGMGVRLEYGPSNLPGSIVPTCDLDMLGHEEFI